MKGRLSMDVTAWCGLCGSWEFTGESTRGRAAKYIRARGWSLTNANGWTCPACAKLPAPPSAGETTNGR